MTTHGLHDVKSILHAADVVLDAAPSTRRGATLRPLKAADIPATGHLFRKVFRSIDAAAEPDLCEYLHALALEAPSYNIATGSLVCAQPDGHISGALITVPMQFIACGRPVSGRLLCAFMSDEQSAAGAAEISLSLRARLQDFAFSDTASPTSLKHFRALGGKVVPLQNLEWTRTLRPAGAIIGSLARRLLRGSDPGIGLLAKPLDALLGAAGWRPAASIPQDLSVAVMPISDFLDHAPALVAHYAVHPRWSRVELAWLVAMAARNHRLGPFSIRSISDRAGQIVGCFVYYGAPGHPAYILNVLAQNGREAAVLDAMFGHLDAFGSTTVVGRAQHALMCGLAHQRGLTLRHKAFACVLTRSQNVAEAAERGDIYIGGLAGEGWSRLMSDF